MDVNELRKALDTRSNWRSLWDAATDEQRRRWEAMDRRKAADMAKRNYEHFLRGEPVERR